MVFIRMNSQFYSYSAMLYMWMYKFELFMSNNGSNVKRHCDILYGHYLRLLLYI